MKCPHCGHWNRASFPRCFQCGTPLDMTSEEVNQPTAAAKPGKVYIRYDEDGTTSSTADDRDKLALDMQTLQERKQKGRQEMQRIREQGARQGIAPTSRHVQTVTGRVTVPPSYKNDVITEVEEVEPTLRPDAIAVSSKRRPPADQPEVLDLTHTQAITPPTPRRSQRNHRRFGLRRFARLAAWLMIAAVVIAGIYFLVQRDQDAPLQEQVIITNTILNDMPAHMIRIPAEEGAVIYIKELRKSYTVTGGYATVEVEDYKWYEAAEIAVEEADEDNREEAEKNLKALLDAESITATITPYIKTSANEQKQMDIITYPVEIPLSPLMLVTPDTGYAEVSTAMYQIQFEVAANSEVTINDEDFSDLVNTQKGLISYNASVAAKGNNEFVITTRAQHCRPSTVSVTLYRAPQAIPLDLATDIATRWSPGYVDDKSQPPDENGKYPQKEDPMVVRCTTLTGAHIEIKTPYANLDLSRINIDGSFEFEAVFTKIGTNTITIVASDPAHPEIEPSVVNHNVYYVPVSAIYTRKAWDIYDMYTDYLNFTQTRVANTQIYVCKGTIEEILSTKPQLAVMALDRDPTKKVLLENLSNDEYKQGQRLRVYGDAYGVYNGMPRLVGRYTYLPID